MSEEFSTDRRRRFYQKIYLVLTRLQRKQRGDSATQTEVPLQELDGAGNIQFAPSAATIFSNFGASHLRLDQVLKKNQKYQALLKKTESMTPVEQLHFVSRLLQHNSLNPPPPET